MELTLTRKLHTRRTTSGAPFDIARSGWFPDPAQHETERFWTGTAWTGLTRPTAQGFVSTVAGVSRCLFDHTISRSSMRTRRLMVTEEWIRWGQYDIRVADITAVSHSVVSDSRDGHWKKLIFVVEGRLGTLRIVIRGVRGETERRRAYDGFRALVSLAESVIVPRIASQIVDRLESGHVVRLGHYRLTNRGLTLKHREGHRQVLSGRWYALNLTTDASGRSLDNAIDAAVRGSVLVRTVEGLPFPALDPQDKWASIMPLVLWLAQDRFTDRDDLRLPQVR